MKPIVTQPCTLLKNALIGLIFGLVATGVAAAEDGGLIWSFTPYLWAVDTTIDLKADGTSIGGGKISFKDLMDSTDEAFQIHTEVGLPQGKWSPTTDGQWSAFIDLSYLEASDDGKVNANGQPTRFDIETEQLFLDAAISFWPRGEAGGFNVFTGVRVTDLDDEFTATDATNGQRLDRVQSDRDFTDVLLGARHRLDLYDNWSLFLRGDYAFGDSDGIYVLEGMFRYAVGRNRQHGLMFGYRYKEAEFEDNNVEEEIQYKGLGVAFNFRF